MAESKVYVSTDQTARVLRLPSSWAWRNLPKNLAPTAHLYHRMGAFGATQKGNVGSRIRTCGFSVEIDHNEMISPLIDTDLVRC